MPNSLLPFKRLRVYLLPLANIHHVNIYSIAGGGGSSGGGFDTHNNNNNNNNTFTYTFHGDPRATFAEFFGTDNPFATFFNLGGNFLIRHSLIF